MEQDFDSQYPSTPYFRGNQFYTPRSSSSNYRSDRAYPRISNRYAANRKLLIVLIYLTMFFGIITLIAYLGITYAVICSLTISTIAMYFFPDKLSILFAEDPYDCTNTSSNNNYFTTPRNQSLFMTPGYGHRYTYGFTQTPGLYRQPCYTPMPMSTPNTSTPQTPPDLSFDTNLIGMYRNNDNNSNASADQVSLLTTKYKSAAMSYGDPNSDAYIRMSENFLKETPLYDSMDYLASNLKVWLSGHVVNKAAKVIDDYKNKSEISEALKEFKDAPRGVSQRYYEERIRELSNDSYLTKYEGNVSKANSGYGSDADRPSDAIIIMDLFGKYMGTKVHYSFSDTYIVTSYQAPSVLKSSNTGIYICLTRQSPTHYDIISYGKVHTILPGPNNVFYAIILFFYYVLSKNNGYLMDGNSIKQITSEIKMDEVIYKKRAQSNKY